MKNSLKFFRQDPKKQCPFDMIETLKIDFPQLIKLPIPTIHYVTVVKVK